MDQKAIDIISVSQFVMTKINQIPGFFTVTGEVVVQKPVSGVLSSDRFFVSTACQSLEVL
jgi:hypothetical protein